MEGARLLSLRLLSLSKYRSKVVTLPRPTTEKRSLKCCTLTSDQTSVSPPPQLWVKEIIPFGERDVIYD
ncbi:hypothetical protein SAMN04487828_2464 [Prevotella sp. lc2012]|nr:hypothetical protein SAMN04487828_2464 [Prevotella sp. lc2012]